MLDTIFKGLFDTATTSVITPLNFMICVVISLIIGLVLALCYTYKTKYTKSFVVSLAIIPAVVCVVIMMVNGNIGAGVAVAGAFSLVRFRSAPGTAKEIGAIFIAMGAGLIAGMGYLAYAVLFTLILSAVLIVYSTTKFGEKKSAELEKIVRVTIPEDLDYTGVFNDLFDEYTKNHELINVKTINLGSLFKITYNITLKKTEIEKEFIDKLRCRNGNLEITVSPQETKGYEL